ncbi:unnamed protein product [Echinostoma caproni]|uniref:PIH1_CS domain-containing protein n=1 Tax=Echinostoma caproni TaxID=27848 RepID=A0A183AQV0_9TREM|nr:unnamed protein product [Echinostoma caproni]
MDVEGLNRTFNKGTSNRNAGPVIDSTDTDLSDTEPFAIQQEYVPEKLLILKPNKLPGPYQLKATILKECTHTL